MGDNITNTKMKKVVWILVIITLGSLVDALCNQETIQIYFTDIFEEKTKKTVCPADAIQTLFSWARVIPSLKTTKEKAYAEHMLKSTSVTIKHQGGSHKLHPNMSFNFYGLQNGDTLVESLPNGITGESSFQRGIRILNCEDHVSKNGSSVNMNHDCGTENVNNDIFALLSMNPTIGSLDLSGFGLGEFNACQVLPKYLKNMKNLQALHLRGNKLNPAGTECIARQLFYLKKLTMLDLSHNEMGPSGAAGFSQYLRALTSLEDLALSSNNINDIGAMKEIISAIRNLNNLKYLGLQKNNLSKNQQSVVRRYYAQTRPNGSTYLLI